MMATARSYLLAHSIAESITLLKCFFPEELAISAMNRWRNTPSRPYSCIHRKWTSTVLLSYGDGTNAGVPSSKRKAVSYSCGYSSTSGHRSMVHQPGSKRRPFS